jgi:hypothetical protein
MHSNSSTNKKRMHSHRNFVDDPEAFLAEKFALSIENTDEDVKQKVHGPIRYKVSLRISGRRQIYSLFAICQF